MSNYYSASSRTNKTPWTDKIALITDDVTVDNEGYETHSETQRIIKCTFLQGINRNEFYEGMKAGIKLSASAECWQSEYHDEKQCIYKNTRFDIVRSFETGRGTVELSLSEVVR